MSTTEAPAAPTSAPASTATAATGSAAASNPYSPASPAAPSAATASASAPPSSAAMPKSAPTAPRRMAADPVFDQAMALLAGEHAEQERTGEDSSAATQTDATDAAETDTPAAPHPEASTDTPANPLIEKAVAAGVDKALAESLGDDLPAYLGIVTSEAFNLGGAAPAAETNKPAATPPTNPTTTPTNQPEDHFAELRDKYDDALLDGLNKVMDAKLQGATSKVQKLEQTLQGYEQAAHTKRVADMESQFEQAFQSIGEVFKPLVGEGKTEALSPKSPAARMRMSIAQQTLALNASRQQIGLPELPVSQAVSAVLAATYPNLIRQDERAKLRKSHAQRQASAVSEPARKSAVKSDDALLSAFKDILERPD